MKKILFTHCLIVFFTIFLGKVNGQTTLSPGDIVIVAINGDNDATNSYGRGFSFLTLVNLQAGTEIFFTDYGWSDLTNYFITNTSVADQFAKYIVPSGGLEAGTIVRFDVYHTTDFTVFYCYGSASLTTYLNVAGLTNGDEVLAFQASYDPITHVFSSIQFIYAASIVSTAMVPSGWATNVGTNGTDGSGAGSALPPGLTDDATALSFNQPATANDNCAYSGSTTAATKALWQDRIKNYSNWTFNDAPPIPTPPTGPFTVTGSTTSPTVTTQAVTSIASTTATGNGNITNLGVPNPTQYGVVWSTSANPTVALTTKTAQGAASATGAFTSSITGLSANTTYYVNAYATNTAGTSYGTEVNFTTSAATTNIFEDFESYSYAHWALIASGSTWTNLKIYTEDMDIVFIHTATEGPGTGNGAKSISAASSSSSSWVSYTHKDRLPFTLNSMALSNPNTTWGSQYLTVRGYRNGSMVKEQTDVANWSTTTPVTTTYTGWDNIDSVLILEPNMGTGEITYLAAYIDDISLSNISSSTSVPTVTTQAASSISTTTATGNGNITATGGENATNRGVIWYVFSGTDKLIGDAGVTNVSETGDYGTGTFPAAVTGLAVNTQYNIRAHASNTAGTGYGARTDFWTLANVPSAPTVAVNSATSLNVTVNVNANPAGTEFAIHETSTGKFVQGDGTLGAAAVWQTAATWGTKTVTGLTTGTTYTFEVKARNGGNTETAYGATANGTPVAPPTVTTQAASSITATSATGNGSITATNGIRPTVRGIIYWLYTDTDKILTDVEVTDVAENGTPDFGTGAFTRSLNSMSVNTRYNARAYATNTEGTGYGSRTDFWTLANVPSAPTVAVNSATSLNVTVNVNSNPAGTEFAIHDASTGNYVQADGTLGLAAVWASATVWGTKTVTGLTTGNTYTFEVKARNGNNVETVYGSTSNGTPEAAPTVSTQAATDITTTSATGNGNITATNGVNPTNRGVIYYAYTDTDKIIGDAGVSNVDETGSQSFSTGAFTASLINLSINTRYNARSHATNTVGTGYGSRVDFWTLANVPSTPTVNAATTTTLDVAINANGNPAITTYAIFDTVTGKYVQANGTLGATAVWQTEAQWEVNAGNTAKTVTGLLANSQHTFKVKAKNGNNIETDFSTPTTLYTLALVPGATTVNAPDTTSLYVAINANGNPTATGFAIFERKGNKYVQADGTLGAGAVWQTEALWETDATNTAKKVTGLIPNTEYTFLVKAINGDDVETDFGTADSLFTLANAPSSPTVDNPTATSLDVSINTNGNPASTEFAIQDSINGTYVQANGTRAATAVWQTAANWNTITVTGLSTGVTYYFRAKAKNGDDVETAFGLSTGQNTCSNPTDGGEIGSDQNICKGSTPDSLTSISGATNYGGTLEYKWQSSTQSETAGFADIAGADGLGYQPVAISDTTWFRRLARVDCKADWTEAAVSNVLKITVQPLFVTTQAATLINATIATGNGDITSICTLNATNRGVIWYPYTDTDMTIGETDVTNVSETGNFTTGSYTASLTGLSANTRYNARAHATNTEGTGYGERVDFWTLANVPSAPTVNAATTTTLDVAINANGNPAITTYAIFDTVTGKYVQANGALGATAVWQTEAQWEVNAGNTAKTVTGLSTNSQYTFKVKAKNDDDIETDLGNPTSLYTLAVAPGATTVNGADTTSLHVTINANGNPGATDFAVYERKGNKYVQADGTLGAGAVWQTEALWETDATNTAKKVTGLIPNTEYTFLVKAINGDDVETDFGAADSLYTLANVPSAPTVDNPTATSLDVSINANGNPAATEFAIQDSINGTYVQANGTRAATAVWQTTATWNTTTVTGLSTGVTYYFRVKAKNEDDVETGFGLSTGQNTCSNPTDGGDIGANQTICYGTKPSALTNVTLPSNYGGTLEYKWQYSTDSLSFTDIDHDSIGYAPGNLTDTTWFKRVARVSCKNDWTGAAESNVVKIIVRPQFTAGSIVTTGETICSNGDPAQIEDSISANGGDALISYQWQSSHTSAAAGFTNILNATSASYDPPSGLTDNTWYRRQAKDGTCNTDWETSTGVWKVRIETIPPTALANDTTLYLDSSGTISVTAESIDNGSTDICSISSFSLDKSTFDCTDLGTNPVILTVTDNAGNSATANSVVTIVDTITPVANAKNITIILDPNGNASITGDSIDDGSSDNCSITLTASRTTFNCSDRGPNSVTLTVEDISGNTATANCIVTVEEGTALLPPWENANTHVSANGSATYAPCDDAGTFRLTSTGQSSTTSDVYHYVYQELCGNGTIIARLDEVQNGGWAGVMLRETNDAGSRAILIKTRLYNPTINIGYRSIPNKSMSNNSQVVQMLQWMKIQRNGNTFLVFTSVNGTNWTRRYTSTITMNSCINAGIFTESIKSNRTSIALFDQVLLWNTLKSGDDSYHTEIIDLENEQVDVQIYPNPAKDEVNINLNGFENLSGLEATLISAEGKIMKTFTLSELQTQLNIQGLKPGVYILRVENADNVVVKRLVIQ